MVCRDVIVKASNHSQKVKKNLCGIAAQIAKFAVNARFE